MRNNRLAIIPTGAEIQDGTVLDTDSPEIRNIWKSHFPDWEVCISDPADDDFRAIENAVNRFREEMQLIVIIGGSGGGHRFDKNLGKDFTHTALDHMLEPSAGRSVYGPNGHMWCRLIAGFCGESLVINVPGPFSEAQASFTAFVKTVTKTGFPDAGDTDLLSVINDAMIEAVIKTYER